MSTPAIFLDRDGTLIEDYDYLSDPGQVELLATAPAALRLLKERGFALVVVTNQSAIARGMLTEETLLAIHDRLKALLAEQGAFVDQIYYCPYHPDGVVEKYRRESELRKPAPGMLELAQRELNLDLQRSWMIGDGEGDIAAGRAAGCRTILLDSHTARPAGEKGDVEPDYRAVNLLEAANLIIRYGTDLINNTDAAAPKAAAESTDVAKRRGVPKTTRVPPPEPADVPPEDTVAMDQTAGNHAELLRTSPPAPEPTTRELLKEIVRQLKTLTRERSFAEFSVPKLLAGVMQMLVFLCLILAFWFGSDPEPNTDATHSCLLAAVVLQTMTLTLLLMHHQ